MAADFRKGGDGQRRALLQLVAPLAGVALDELIHRDAQRSARRLAEVAAASACGLAVLGGLGALLVQAQARAANERARGDQMIAKMVGPGAPLCKSSEISMRSKTRATQRSASSRTKTGAR